MDYDAQRVSDELRHKHIRTLELLRELISENNDMRQQLNLGPSERWGEYSEGGGSLIKQVDCLKRELKSSREEYAAVILDTFASLVRYCPENSEVERLREELMQVQKEVEKARAAEKAHELSLSTLQDLNKKLQGDNASLELRCKGQNERFEADVVKLRNQLASRAAEAEEAQTRAKLEISRLESEIEELRRNPSSATLSRNAWVEEFNDDEGRKTVSQDSRREIMNLRQSLRQATRSASTSQRRCIEFQKQAKDEARRREAAERELQAMQAVHLKATPLPPVNGGKPEDEHIIQSSPPLSSAPHLRGSLLSRDDSTSWGRSGRRWTGSTAKRGLDQYAKRLKKSENLASRLETDLQRLAAKNLGTIDLKRENQALRKELAEIKRTHAVNATFPPSGKPNISFPQPLGRHFNGASGIQRDIPSNSSRTRSGAGSPLTTLPRSRTIPTGQKAPLRAVFCCERAPSSDIISGKG